MNVTIFPQKLKGTVPAIPSKSCAHRALICAAFAQGSTQLYLDQVNADIEATAECLNALGAGIQRTAYGYDITPAEAIPEAAVLPCRESGSTLRFLLPVAGALGVDTTFLLEGRLGQRPLSPLWEEMERMGCLLTRPDANSLHCSGRLNSGEYRIAGNISSQFISGLLFAACLMDGDVTITVEGKLESTPYVDMTRDVLAQFGVDTEQLRISSQCRLHSPGKLFIEGDWSNAAFFLTAKALGSQVDITGLNEDSSQGDKAVVPCLEQLRDYAVISAADIPDLIPILSVAAAAGNGAEFTDIQRLRLKESDRVASVVDMIRALGGCATATQDTLKVFGTGFSGGCVDSCNDHRIAMAAAIAATVCKEPVTIRNAQAVNKSYPKFWEDYQNLGGNYEQHLR